jgi:serine/threonine-protein kinase
MNRLDPVSLDDYQLGEPLGSGAMALVFDAVHKKTGAPVAIKLLEGASRGSRELRERMAREAVVLASVESPYVGRLMGHGWEEEQPFLVLERLAGETLAALLRREKRLAPIRMVDWVEQLLLGLRDCHRMSIIHRDVKPANIFLVNIPGQPDPQVKLIDFGVARLNEIAKAGASLTSTHHLIGSVGYMAPEQFEHAKGVGPAADLYGVGVVIFRSLSGRLPFVGRTLDVLAKLKTEATAPRLSSLPGMVPNEELDAFLQRALQREPEARFSTAAEMLQDWWRVAAALDRDAVMPEIDVEFDEEEWIKTIVSSASRAAAEAAAEGSGVASVSSQKALQLDSDMDAATDPQATRPSDRSLAAAAAELGLEPPPPISQKR